MLLSLPTFAAVLGLCLLPRLSYAVPCGGSGNGVLNTNGECVCNANFRDGNFSLLATDPTSAAFYIVHNGDQKCFYDASAADGGADNIIRLTADCAGRGIIFTRTTDGKLRASGHVSTRLLGGCLNARGRQYNSQTFLSIGTCDADSAITTQQVLTSPGMWQITTSGGYWANQCGGNNVCHFVNNGGATVTGEGTQMLIFTNHGDARRVYYSASSVVDQRCLIYDTNIVTPSPTMAPTAPTPEPTASPTSYLFSPEYRNNISALQTAVLQLLDSNNNLQSEVQSLRSTLEEAIVGNRSESEESMNNRVTSLENRILQAFRVLPSDGDSQDGCDDAVCSPSIEASGNNLDIKSIAGQLTFHTSNCGAFDPCDILTSLSDLRTAITNSQQ